MNRRRPSTSRGHLVVVEGIDGSGKSTLARAVRRGLLRKGFSVGTFREPTDPELGGRALAAGHGRPWEAAMWFTLDRFLARPRVERALARFDVVVQDRSFASTLAYQGSAMPPSSRRRLEAWEERVALPPDLVVLIDLPVEEALYRLGRRSMARAPFERSATLQAARAAYLRYARRSGWWVVDGRRPARELAQAIVGHLTGLLRPRGGARRDRHLPRRGRPRR